MTCFCFFSTPEYRDNPKVIVKYDKWATRSDSLSVWGKLIPMECTVPEDHPDYIVSCILLIILCILPNVYCLESGGYI